MDESRIDPGRGPDGDTGRVGLGRVVEDHRPETGDATPVDAPPTDETIEEASEDSFPASDPPTFMSDAATPAERGHAPDEAIELPVPREMP